MIFLTSLKNMLSKIINKNFQNSATYFNHTNSTIRPKVFGRLRLIFVFSKTCQSVAIYKSLLSSIYKLFNLFHHGATFCWDNQLRQHCQIVYATYNTRSIWIDSWYACFVIRSKKIYNSQSLNFLVPRDKLKLTKSFDRTSKK